MSNPSPLKTIYRILTWSSLAGLVLVLALILRKSPSPDMPYDPSAAARVEQKFAAADQAKAAGQPAQVQLDRTELNSYLQQNLELAGSAAAAAASAPAAAPGNSAASPVGALSGADQPSLEEVQSSVKDVKVDMDGDLVKAYVVFNFHGQDLPLELDGHLASQGGYLKFEPVAGKLGSMPLPQSMLDLAVQKMMASPENREKLKLPADISDIQVQNGQAVVSYK
ncbi:MAG: hypothetical protein LAN36_14010 [Acidobacteriia bacterium]|nr:hypothetical protein [Terriglobia bacterium]